MPAQHQMNMKKGFTALFFAFTTITGMSQQFDVSGNLSAPDLTEANSVWADFDNDGDMDLLLAGIDGIGFSGGNTGSGAGSGGGADAHGGVSAGAPRNSRCLQNPKQGNKKHQTLLLGVLSSLFLLLLLSLSSFLSL